MSDPIHVAGSQTNDGAGCLIAAGLIVMGLLCLLCPPLILPCLFVCAVLLVGAAFSN